MKKRIEWIDFGKGICILFVIISHFSCCPYKMRIFFSPFFLSFFFFLSGYNFKCDNFKPMIIKKSKQLLVPWLFFSIIEILLKCISGDNFFRLFMFNLLQIKGLNESFWFLPCLYISFVFFFFLNKITKKRKILVSGIFLVCGAWYGFFMNPNVLPWHSIALPWHIDKLPLTLCFMLLGSVLRELEWNVNKKVYLISIAYFGIPVFLNKICSIVDFNYNIFIWTFIMLFGIFFIYSMSRIINRVIIINFIGENSLLYFLIHVFILKIVNFLLLKYDVGESWIITIIGTVIVTIILILPIKFIKKHFAFILGKF